jgi:integrase
MARPPSVWHRAQDDHFYTTLRGKKIKLSPDKKEATRLFHELLAKHEEPAGSNISPSFRKVADLFLDESERTKAPNTFRMLRMLLQSFCDEVQAKRVADLKVHHVTAWVGERQRPSKPGEKTRNGKHFKSRVPWNESTACTARASLLACLNWAVGQGIITGHPLTQLKRGSHKRRERYLSPAERQSIREFVGGEFADFLLAMELSGARPFSELSWLTADKISWKSRTITIENHKNLKKNKTRTIYLSAPLADLLRRKCKERPTGLLFRNRLGGRWQSHDAGRRLDYAAEKLGLNPAGEEKIVSYSFRHSYCTDALAAGLNVCQLGELVGNSPQTLSRHYDHLSRRRDVMINAAELVAGKTAC